VKLNDGERYRIVRGEALGLLQQIPDGSIDCVITDPPYSSGGQFRGDRMGASTDKYTGSDVEIERPAFSGDNRDQRSFAYWCALWFYECLRIVRPGGGLCVFSDWRQLPTLSDSIQAGGWVWRGIVPWDKTEATRPRMGGFRSQCEYILWSTAGPIDAADADAIGVLPGCYRFPVRQDDKFHITGKPTVLMRELVKFCRVGGVVLDPFCGSGTTLVAALGAGRRALGFELTHDYADMAEKRCAAETTTTNWREPHQLGLLAPPKV
jgi:site-specific DNA-methyltransferase (adenine-specific)